MNVMKNAVQCVNGHSFCEGCADSWKRRSDECPFCKVKLDLLIPNRTVAAAVAEAEVVCFTRLGTGDNLIDDEHDDYAAAASHHSDSNGVDAAGKRKAAGIVYGKGKAKGAKFDVCRWVGKLEDAERHFKVCPYAGVRCSHDGCGALVGRRDLPDHEQTCKHRKQPCKWAGCRVTLPANALAAHESICIKREMRCPNGGCSATRMSIDVLAAHLHTCGFEMVACPFAGAGCTARVPRKDIDAHKQESMSTHMELLLQKVNSSEDLWQQEVRSLKREVQVLQQKVNGSEDLRQREVGWLIREVTVLQQKVNSSDDLEQEVRSLKRKEKVLQQKVNSSEDLWQQEVRSLKRKEKVLQQEVRSLEDEVNTLKARDGKEVIVMKIKHAKLTGAEQFVPQNPAQPASIFSEKRVVDGHTFRMMVDTNDSRAPAHYGVFLSIESGPLPCKVECTMKLVHHDGQELSALVSGLEHTYETHLAGWGHHHFVSKACLADAAASPYVKNGYVTFKCSFEVVE